MDLKKNPAQCLHEDFLLAPAVERSPNAQTGKMDFVLVMTVRCGHCDMPFLFTGPIGFSNEGKQLHLPIAPESALHKFLGTTVGIG